MITLNKEDAFTIVDIISKAQEVIRCKDCKWWLQQGEGYPDVCIRDEMEKALDDWHPLVMDADDFCSNREFQYEVSAAFDLALSLPSKIKNTSRHEFKQPYKLYLGEIEE